MGITSLENLLEELRAARNDPDSFDLSIADALCDFYEPSEVCDMLTDDQKNLSSLALRTNGTGTIPYQKTWRSYMTAYVRSSLKNNPSLWKCEAAVRRVSLL